MESALPLVAAGALALLLASGIIPAVIAVSHRRSWFDIPDDRKIHTDPIPRLGGVGIFIGLMGGCLAVPLLFPLLLPSLDPPRFDEGMVFVFLGFTLIHGMGLLDDFHNLRAWLKFLLQLVAAALVTVGGFTISRISFPGIGSVSLGVVSYPLTVLWIVAISNAINLVDGIDGLAGGISAWTALSLAIISILSRQPVPALVSLSLLGAVMGFLAFNFPPARIFMGDSGSLLLGFVLAVIPLLGSRGGVSGEDMATPATLLLVPIIDTILAITRRARQGRAIYAPDKEHLHHRLLAVGMKDTRILLVMYSVCVAAGIASVTAVFLGRGERLVLLLCVWVLAIAALGTLDSVRRRKSAGAHGLVGKH